jgi:hypothetical protein
VRTVQAKCATPAPIAHRVLVRYRDQQLAVLVLAVICQLQLQSVHCSAPHLSVR